MIIEGNYETREVKIEGHVLDPRPSQRAWNHSPDGFAWGYGGSGPAQLALAVLLKAGVPKSTAVALHQRFKAEHIATLHQDDFHLEVDIDAWVKENSKTTVVPTEDESESQR